MFCVSVLFLLGFGLKGKESGQGLAKDNGTFALNYPRIVKLNHVFNILIIINVDRKQNTPNILGAAH